MKLPDGWSPATPVFDDDALVSCAGLVPVLALAERAGLSELIGGQVSFNATKVKSLGVNPAGLGGGLPVRRHPPTAARSRSRPSSTNTPANASARWSIATSRRRPHRRTRPPRRSARLPRCAAPRQRPRASVRRDGRLGAQMRRHAPHSHPASRGATATSSRSTWMPGVSGVGRSEGSSRAPSSMTSWVDERVDDSRSRSRPISGSTAPLFGNRHCPTGRPRESNGDTTR